jgi:hypothetical protein
MYSGERQHSASVCHCLGRAINPALFIDGQLVPGAKGIILPEDVVKTLFSFKDRVQLAHPSLATLQPFADE